MEGQEPGLLMGCCTPSLTDTNHQLSRVCVPVLCGTNSGTLLQSGCCEQDEYGISGGIGTELSSFIGIRQLVLWSKSNRDDCCNLSATEEERAVGFKGSDLSLS